MTVTKKTILYTVYVLLLLVILTFALFPDDAVRNHLSNRLNQNLPDIQVDIGRLDLRFPPSLSLGDLLISRKNTLILSLDRLRLSPKWLSLFSDRKALLFLGDIYQGEISGILRAVSNENGFDISSSGNFSGISIGLSEIIRMQPGLELSGILAGDFQIDASSGTNASGKGSIVVSECNLSLSEAYIDVQRLLNIEQFEFDRIKADVYIDGSRLTIQNGEFSGAQLKGRVSGNVFIESPFSLSEMALEISVSPLLSSTLSEINELKFSATGTFENPKISNLVVL